MRAKPTSDLKPQAVCQNRPIHHKQQQLTVRLTVLTLQAGLPVRQRLSLSWYLFELVGNDSEPAPVKIDVNNMPDHIQG